MTQDGLFTTREAAEYLGLSYDVFRQDILKRYITPDVQGTRGKQHVFRQRTLDTYKAQPRKPTGKPYTGRKNVSFFATPEEHEMLGQRLAQLRGEAAFVSDAQILDGRKKNYQVTDTERDALRKYLKQIRREQKGRKDSDNGKRSQASSC